MEITVKFDIGDVVYYNINHEIREAKITKIDINKEGVYPVRILYHLHEKNGRDQWMNEERLHELQSEVPVTKGEINA